MKNPKNIKNIIFDLGNVVLPLSIKASIEAFKELGISNGFEDTLCTAQTSKLFDDFEIGAITPSEFLSEMKKHCKLSATDEDIVSAWNAMLLDYDPERIKLLKQLSEHHNTFLLSNTNQLHYDHFIRTFSETFGYDFDSLFVKAYYSHEMNMRKPTPEIFSRVLDEQKLVAEETLFLDDNEANLDSAHKLGINVQHITLEYTILDFFTNDNAIKPSK